MESDRQAPRKIFWGWYVVAGAFITVAINYGARYSFGVFLKPMCEDLGWSRSIVSFAMTLFFFFYGVGGVIAGRLLDLFAPRWIVVAGSLTAMYAILNINRFGVDISGTAIGLTNFFGTGLGGSLGPIFGGIIYDTTGSYTFAWQVNLGVLVGVTVLIEFLKPAFASESAER